MEKQQMEGQLGKQQETQDHNTTSKTEVQIGTQDKQNDKKKAMLKDFCFKIKDKKIKVNAKTVVAFQMTKTDSTPVEIVKHVFLGSIGAALSVKQLQSLNIVNILDAQADNKAPNYPQTIKNYKNVDLHDSIHQVIIGHLEQSNEFIRNSVENGENILVHCFAGKSRSVTLILAYMMYYHKMTRDEALEIVRLKRPQASPNYGFMKQLLLYENILIKEGKIIQKPSEKQQKLEEKSQNEEKQEIKL